MISAKAPRGRRLSAEARQMLRWCVALSAAAHVLLLAGIASSPHPSRAGGWTAHAGGRPTRTASVRLIQPASTPFVAATASAAVAMPSAPASAASISGAAMVADGFAPTGFVSSARTARAKASAASASDAVGETGEGTEAPEGGYVPRPLLSVAPEPVIPVVIAVPPAAAAGRLIGRYSAVLALYIDEEGRVRRIEAESPALPEPMERAARQAFLAARFSPGQVAGQVVKSRIRVEVVFDDEPASSAAALAASAASRAGTSADSGVSASAAPSAQRLP